MKEFRIPPSIAAGLFAAATIAGTPAAAAQEWPSRPIRLIVPFAPGGSNDIVGRIVAAQLTERLGKTVVVDNRGGAGGIIGMQAAATAAPDGYTLLVISATFTMNASIMKLPYDPKKSFAPVAMLGSGTSALTVPASFSASSVKDLVARAKKEPGKLTAGGTGVGSYQHLTMEMFKQMTGTDILVVHYKGGGPILIDLVGGQLDMAIGTLAQALPHIRSGRLKNLATTGPKRSPLQADVPTMIEAGVPGYQVANWWGMLAPAGTTPAVIARLNREVAALQKTDEVQKRFAAEASETVTLTPEQFRKFIDSEMVKWARVAKDAGIKPE
ncbi:MAG TPA: tripartite tricarboxylate transporter substrate binding protein [Burkholderiales bacterium]|nr:tripartite tricarboxylate transporter substrate binding protein [Burkholderiales bacterium]